VIGVLEPNDVVLAKITSALDLDELDRCVAGVLEAVNGAEGDVDVLIRTKDANHVAHGHLCSPVDHHPMLRTMAMFLQRQLAIRMNDDALHLPFVAAIGDLVPAPRPMDARVAVFTLHERLPSDWTPGP
jgi:hypothetical protein